MSPYLSGNSCDISLCTSSRPSFFILFSVSVGLCIGFLCSSTLVLLIFSGSGFSVYLPTSNTESCDEDDGEVGVGVVEELATRDSEWHIAGYVAINSLAIFGEVWFLTAGPVTRKPMILVEFPE